MVTATRYMVEKLEGRDKYQILNQDAPLCPSCGALLSGYDTRARHIVSGEGRSIWFRLRRLRCPVCCRLHLEVPDFVRANKHYTADMIRLLLLFLSPDKQHRSDQEQRCAHSYEILF